MGMNRKLRRKKKTNTKFGTVQCDECKNDFSVNTTNLRKDAITIDKSKFHLLHLVCPHCGKSYDVQLDNDETSKILETLQSILRKMSKLKKSGMNQKEKSDFKELDLKKVEVNNLLTVKRNALIKKFNGELYKIVGISNKEFILDFKKVN